MNKSEKIFRLQESLYAFKDAENGPFFEISRKNCGNCVVFSVLSNGLYTEYSEYRDKICTGGLILADVFEQCDSVLIRHWGERHDRTVFRSEFSIFQYSD